MTSWNMRSLGIRWITLLVDDPSDGPPTTRGAQIWKDGYGLESSAVCADPAYSFGQAPTDGTPRLVIVDPRTMQVVDIQQGYTGDHSKLTSLAAQNTP